MKNPAQRPTHPRRLTRATAPRAGAVIAALALSLAAGASAESDGPSVSNGAFDVPDRPPLDRYAKLWEKSPFEFEIIVEEEVIEEENPFEDLALASFSSDGSVNFVTIVNTKEKEADRIRLRSDRPSEDGYRILRVERGANYKETVVHLQKGDAVGKVTYDERQLSMKPSGAMGGPAPGARNPAQGNNPAAALAAARAAAARGGNNPAAQAQQQAAARGGNAPNAAAQAGGQQQPGTASQNRNEVIQRLLERARERQAQAQQRGGNDRGGGGGDQPRRRRVVLPPSTQ